MNSEQLVHYAAIAMWLGSARMDGIHIQDEDAEARCCGSLDCAELEQEGARVPSET